MKQMLAATFILAALAAPAMANEEMTTPRAFVEASVGQPVYDLQNMSVGKIDGYIDVHGTPSAIVSTSEAFGGPGHRVLVPAQDLGRRSEGGLLLAMSNSTVSDLYTYDPNALPVW